MAHEIASKMKSLLCVLLGAAVSCIAGCGGASKTVATTTLPTPATPGKFNTYIGTQGAQNVAAPSYIPQGGLLTASLNDTTADFTWQNTTYGYPSPGTLGGKFTVASGFLDLSTVSYGTVNNPLLGASPGYALELPGRAVLLRPGDNTIPPAMLVPSLSAATASCQVINNPAVFQFVTLPDPLDAVVETPPFAETYGGPAYGVVSASGKGTNYILSSYQSFYLGGASAKPAALGSGLCAQTLAGAAVTIAADTTNNVPATTIAIGPTGFFLMDQTEEKSGSSNGRPGGLGVIQPTSALDVTSIVAGKYLGFEFEPAYEGQTLPDGSGLNYPITNPVAFGVTAGKGTSIVGGFYPNDDPTQKPLTDTTINLGTQDASSNGLFPKASVTIPDPGSVCAFNGRGTVGIDGAGNPTCSFPAVIVAGNPEGKFALFLIANDFVSSSAMGIYLFQQ
jgi:hypothetical protein